MDEQALRALIADVRNGAVSEEECLRRLRALPFEDLGFAMLDHHRHLRTGFPEVIYAQGKTPEQVAQIFDHLHRQHATVMATRVNDAQAAAVSAVVPDAIYHPAARVLTWHREPVSLKYGPGGDKPRPYIAVVAAGTADLPVAEEAALTAETVGWAVDRLYDVGVAGLHRLLAHGERLQRARVLVVVAGMEGALASVVGGLVAAPVIAVPTSVGYGAAFNGLAALLTMLNSCANGVAVMNIDNGFGAGYYAAMLAGMIQG